MTAKVGKASERDGDERGETCFFFLFAVVVACGGCRIYSFHRTLKRIRVTRPAAIRVDSGLRTTCRLAPLDFDVNSSFFTTSLDNLSKSSVDGNKKSVKKIPFLF